MPATARPAKAEDQADDQADEGAGEYTPMVGDTIAYRLTDQDVDRIIGRDSGPHFAVSGRGGGGVLSPWAAMGNAAGTMVPGIVTRVYSPDVVNAHVLLDGPGTLWVASRVRGSAPGEWEMPA